MEKEPFGDNGVAKYLNETFISIKADREDRPDIDCFDVNPMLCVEFKT